MDLRPLAFTLPSVTAGDTWPALRLQESDADTDLAGVRCKVKSSIDGTALLELTSAGSGITITTATAGAWDFQLDAIPAVTLDPGIYYYDIETTDSAGTIRTEFAGTWRILKEITD